MAARADRPAQLCSRSLLDRAGAQTFGSRVLHTVNAVSTKTFDELGGRDNRTRLIARPPIQADQRGQPYLSRVHRLACERRHTHNRRGGTLRRRTT